MHENATWRSSWSNENRKEAVICSESRNCQSFLTSAARRLHLDPQCCLFSEPAGILCGCFYSLENHKAPLSLLFSGSTQHRFDIISQADFPFLKSWRISKANQCEAISGWRACIWKFSKDGRNCMVLHPHRSNSSNTENLHVFLQKWLLSDSSSPHLQSFQDDFKGVLLLPWGFKCSGLLQSSLVRQHSKGSRLLKSLPEESVSQWAPPLRGPGQWRGRPVPHKHIPGRGRLSIHGEGMLRRRTAVAAAAAMKRRCSGCLEERAEMTGTAIKLPYLEKGAQTARGGEDGADMRARGEGMQRRRLLWRTAGFLKKAERFIQETSITNMRQMLSCRHVPHILTSYNSKLVRIIHFI